MALSDLVLQLRIICGDKADSHVIFGEGLGSIQGLPIDGTNRVFRIGGQDGHSLPVVVGSIYVTTVGGTPRTQTGFTLTDATYGVITFSVAPVVNAVVLVDYNYYWFSDASYNEFLAEAAGLTMAGTAATAMPDGLSEAMLQYAASLFFTARASQYAERYSSSGGEAGQSVESVSKAYIAMAAAAKKRADTVRDDFYKGQGQEYKAAVPSTAVVYRIDPITPRH